MDSVNQAHVLCSMCQQFPQSSSLLHRASKSIEMREIHNHHPSLERLEESARGGCHLCHLLYDSLKSYTGDPSAISGLHLVAYYDDGAKRQVNEFGRRSGARDWHCWLQCNLALASRQPDGSVDPLVPLDVCRTKHMPKSRRFHINPTDEEWDPLGTVNPDIAQFSRSTGSGKCLQMAKRWLEKCLTSHASCGQWSGQSLPTRLLDVGDSTGSDTIRLALADEVPDGSPYLTLSYCWGKTKPVVLKNALVATFRKAITIPALPKTIQDAIDITRKLGYQFLWVDSLCIIQDSHDDWEQEAKKMDRVYLDSTLTIAATASASNEGGCFRDREPLSYLPCRISGTQQNGLYVCRSRFSRTVHKIQERFIDTAPLNTRAWVLQERILSRRILHFTDNTLYWDCSVLQATDSCPDGYRVSNNILQPNRNLRWRLRNLMGPDPKTERGSFYLDKTLNLVRRAFPSFETPAMWDTERTFYHDWQTIVRMYSSCHLTVRSDKKVALGGIVQWLQRGRSFQYAEGFWYRNTLAPQQLLWASDATEPLARPEFRGAPSWSWLSVDGPIKFAIATPTESDIRDQLFEWSSEWIARSTVSILDNTEPGSTTIHNNTRALCLDAKLLRINLATWRHFRADCKFAPSHTSPVFAAFLVERVSAYAQLLVGDTNTRPSCTKGFAGLILVRSENDDTFTRVGMFKFDPLEMWAHKTSTLEAREFRVMADLERVVDSLEVSAVHIV